MIGKTLFLALLLPISAAATEDYEELFETAVRQVTWEYPVDWAYTETRRGKDMTQVGRFDPSLPESERWTLISVDGRKPTTEEAREYMKDKRNGGSMFGGDDDDDGDESDVDSLVEPGTLTLLEESDAHWLLRFIPEGDDKEEDRFLEKMDGTVRIAKPAGQLEYIDISNSKPVKPTVGVRIRDFNTRFEFARAMEPGPVVPVAFRFRIKGRAFLAIGFDETETVEFSDFERISE